MLKLEIIDVTDIKFILVSFESRIRGMTDHLFGNFEGKNMSSINALFL